MNRNLEGAVGLIIMEMFFILHIKHGYLCNKDDDDTVTLTKYWDG